MFEPSNVIERKFNAETHRIASEAKLREFGEFLEKFNELTNENKKSFRNNLNVTLKPILLDVEAHESGSILDLTRSENKILFRILSTLGSICQEIELLKTEAQQLCVDFLFYGEDIGKSLQNLESVSKLVEPLQKLHAFVIRARQVLSLTLKQLTAILTKEYYVSGNNPSFSEILNLFGDLLICLLKFDYLLDKQILKEHWLLYRRALRNILHNSAKYNFSKDEVRDFDKTLAVLETILLSGTIFKDSTSNLDSKLIYDIKKSTLNAEFQTYLFVQISELEKDEENILCSEMLLQLNVVAAFYFNVFESTNRKFIKKLLELNKKVLACTLIGNIVWYPEQFFLKNVQSLAKYIDQKNIESNRLTQIHIKNQNLPKETNLLCLQTCYYLVELDKQIKVNMGNLKVKQLQYICVLLLDGLKLVQKINSTIKWVMNVHFDKMLPVTKTVLVAISKLVEILKSIYLNLNQNIILLVHLVLLISQHLQYKALSILISIKKDLVQDRSYKDQQHNIMSALNICENAIKGPNTKNRLLVANLALSASGLNNSKLNDVQVLLSQLGLISRYTEFLQKRCDCSVLYWHYNYILPVYLSKLVSSKSDVARYMLMLNALTDCDNIGGKEISSAVSKILNEKFFAPVNQIVETNLRMQTHLHLQLPPSDPFQNVFPLNFNKYMPVLLGNVYKSVKNEAEHYLSTMFYNLTTVVLHDWKTYGEMRKLAYLQYSLNTVDDDLPMQTLDQGLDVLEIMRNINVFVQKYLYNLNSQVFVEQSSNNKHLNSINISHVSNSIRTHGIGIMNTTVNFIYQFLKNKFHIFSQFMFDEHIKSRLLKDLRFFSEHKTEFNQMYPYERAEKFNVGIRKLGLNQDGESYLDLFRKLITHIGNAMGYIRLIRSGGKRCLAEGTCFIPDLTGLDNFKEILQKEQLTELSQKAVQCLLHDLQNFIENFEEATEYFKLLVNVFLSVFRNPSNMHLKNFFVIVPPLTINFVEHSLTSKERLYKKNKANSAFTDDGFALGLAYIIQLLDQESQLNSLHWFHSVNRKFKNERMKIKEQTLISNGDDAKLKQTLNLTEKRINTFEREFELFYYSYTSARLFFQA
ncbi:WASH complex subunit 4 [Cylas formicarius]|uniref:WASH complex subunit 4 n=1 Tax=Cylas formicarius TaxID=197179 RepID=UPI0029585DCA|nr:WASH complex subunit 4 [Cylas formicarius]